MMTDRENGHERGAMGAPRQPTVALDGWTWEEADG